MVIMPNLKSLKKRRKSGTIYVTSNFLEIVRNSSVIFQAIIPIRIEYLYDRSEFKIDCYSEWFDEIEDAEALPVYLFIFTLGIMNEEKIIGVKRGKY